MGSSGKCFWCRGPSIPLSSRLFAHPAPMPYPLTCTHSAEEVASLVLTVNGDLRLSEEQLFLVVKEMVLVANGGQSDFDSIALDGLKRLYTCGIGDLRHDMEALGCVFLSSNNVYSHTE